MMHSRRQFLRNISILCVASATAPALLQAAQNQSFSESTADVVPSITRFSIMPGKVSSAQDIETQLKSIKGVEAVKYDATYKFATIKYIPDHNTLPSIVEAARTGGINIQRLRCDKRAPYCNRKCQICPAKLREF